MKIALDKKILAGFFLRCAVLSIVALISYTNSTRFVESNDWVNYTHDVIDAFSQRRTNVIEAEKPEFI